MTVEIRRGTARFVDREPGRRTQHAFSFGAHYDPERLSLGPMVCHDDHLLGPGRGFAAHRHSDLLVVSWVVEGTLVHTGTGMDRVELGPGSVAVMSAGVDGSEHAEHAEHASPDGLCHFVQVWLRPGEESDVLVPAGTYEHGTPDLRLDVPVPIAQPRLDAVLWAVRLSGAATTTVELPTAPLVHAYVASGALLRSSLAEPLSAGDAFVMTDEHVRHTVAAGVPTDLLVWTFHDGPAPVFTGTGTGSHWSAAPADDRDRPPEEREPSERPVVGRLRMMGEYGGIFLWDEDGPIGGPGEFDYLHRHLGLDRALFDDLVRWGDDWVAQSGVPEHDQRGRDLFARLQDALPDRELDLRL